MATPKPDNLIHQVERAPASKRQLLVAAILTVWIIGVGYGMASLARYETAAGDSGSHPRVWPAASHIIPAADDSTLLLFAHPHCPCTRSTIGELERIVARCGDHAEIHVLFIEPDDVSEDWSQSDLQNYARKIPGVRILIDRRGREANLFAAATSGQVLLYDKHRKLRFSGGITALRGHAGDNIGSDAVLSLLSGSTHAPVGNSFAVFGCPLFHSDAVIANRNDSNVIGTVPQSTAFNHADNTESRKNKMKNGLTNHTHK